MIISTYLKVSLSISNFLFHDKWIDKDEANTETHNSQRIKQKAICEYQLFQQIEVVKSIRIQYKASKFENEIN